MSGHSLSVSFAVFTRVHMRRQTRQLCLDGLIILIAMHRMPASSDYVRLAESCRLSKQTSIIARYDFYFRF